MAKRVKIDPKNWKSLGFFGRINGESYEYSWNTDGATYNELCGLLGCLKIIERTIVNHLEDLEPDVEIKRDGFDG